MYPSFLTLAALVLRFPVPGVKQAAAICDDLVALVAGVVGHTLVSSLLPLLAPGVILFIVIIIIVIVIKHLQTKDYLSNTLKIKKYSSHLRHSRT